MKVSQKEYWKIQDSAWEKYWETISQYEVEK